MGFRKCTLLATLAILLALGSQGHAAAIEYTNRGTFEGLGSIAFDSNFNDFGGYFSYPGSPFTRGDVTYTTVNLITGPTTGYAPIENVMTSDAWSPIGGTIANGPQYNMFGFDAGYGAETDTDTITLTTNLATYVFSNVQFPHYTTNFDFYGFVATGAGEYFTGFNIQDNLQYGHLAGITNVDVGNAGPSVPSVPEPTSLLLLGSGLATLAAKLRRRTA